jgi:hypothetical protein
MASSKECGCPYEGSHAAIPGVGVAMILFLNASVLYSYIIWRNPRRPLSL